MSDGDSTGEKEVVPRPERGRRGLVVTMGVLAVLIALALSIFVLRSGSILPAALATVTAAEEARNEKGEPIAVGEVIGSRPIVLASGLLELSAGEVHLAIEGSATFQFLAPDRIRLDQGHLSVKGAEAFVVETAAGEIADLGSRFGVSVDEAAVEGHVFDGELVVKQEGAESIRLVTGEAMVLGSSARREAEANRFPMPSFLLSAGLKGGGFEAGTELRDRLPVRAGVWGGGYCEIVGNGGRVVPHSGESMVSFLLANKETAAPLSQLVDLSDLADEINQGAVTVSLRSFFNRLATEASSNTQSGVGVIAYRGAIPEAADYWDRKKKPLSEKLSESATSIQTDSDPATWEEAVCSLSIPPGTDFLIVQISALRDISGDAPDEFEGQFADSVSLELSVAPRTSRPLAKWKGGVGAWNDVDSWASGRIPDPERDSIEITGSGEAVILEKVVLEQSLTIAAPVSSVGRLRIAPGGELEKSGAGQLIVGSEEGARGELVVEGTLRSRGPVFIGRNNENSRVVVDSGVWQASEGLVRMAQYGDRGPDTISSLVLRNGGVLRAGLIELIHDDALLRIESRGRLEADTLRLGGVDGRATLEIVDGVLQIEHLEFTAAAAPIVFSGREAALELSGFWSAKELRSLPNSDWSQVGPLIRREFSQNGRVWTRFQIQER